MKVAIAIAIAVAIAARVAHAGNHTAWVTAYSTHEHLTGCYAPGKCRTACGGLLDDNRLTVASNPRLRLSCGMRVNFCYRAHCAVATVTDRTGSNFDFEFSYRLALATGQSRGNWATPRHITYWVIGRY